jgi:hypothetical protein
MFSKLLSKACHFYVNRFSFRQEVALVGLVHGRWSKSQSDPIYGIG